VGGVWTHELWAGEACLWGNQAINKKKRKRKKGVVGLRSKGALERGDWGTGRAGKGQKKEEREKREARERKEKRGKREKKRERRKKREREKKKRDRQTTCMYSEVLKIETDMDMVCTSSRTPYLAC